jgi:predicted RNase H-like HicB family nuclease
MRLNVTVAISQEDDWYVAKCLENSVASQGKCIDEAMANLKEALELYFEDNVSDTPQQTFVTTMEIAVY